MDTRSASRAPAVGVGPYAVAQLMRDRSLRLAVGLAIAVAIPVAVLFYFQFRSLSNLGRSSAVVLRQFSSETANRLAKDIDEALKAPHIGVLLRITQERTEPLDLAFIRQTFDTSIVQDTFIARYYVWSDVDGAHRNQLLAYDRGHRTFDVDPPESALLMRQIRDLVPRKRAIVAFPTTIAGRTTYVQAQLRFTPPTTRGRMTSLVAITVDAEDLRRSYFPTLVATHLKEADGPTGFPPLGAAILDDSGRVVYPADGTRDLSVVDQRRFPLVFFDKELLSYAEPLETHRETWTIQTGYRRPIPDIIQARERPQRVLMAILAGVMALGVFFVARVAAREVRLAELKSNFVSSVSHDLKTPLALIQLFAETLELGRLKNTDRAQEYYRIINSEARKLTRLINNLLDFSRIEAGLRRYKIEPLDLGALTRRVVEALQSQFQHNQFVVAIEVAPNVPPVMIDPEAAEQALENLLSNAMKYSPDDRRILVEVDAVPGFGRVRVTDHGIGIPPRLQRKIFRKFYRVEHDAGSGAQGTGLGLAIVDHVMRAHGGFVRVDSEPGRGSTFTLHFPLFAEAQGDETDSGDRGRATDVARSA